MEYRKFGKTQVDMPVLTFGAMRSMSTWNEKIPEKESKETEEKLFQLVSSALSHGINHIETAHGYGSSEYELGRILPRFNRKDLIVQTKVSPSDAPQQFIDKVMLSLEHLQLDHIDLLAIHGINDYKSLWQSCRKNGCLQAARYLQKKGIIGHVGFSGHGPLDVILEAINCEENGGFDFLNLHWYYIFDVNRPAIELARKKDLGVYIISPTDKGGRLWEPSTIMQRCCSPLSPIMFNDLYCLMQEGVTGIGIGASAPTHFDEHLKAVSLLEDEKTRSLVKEIDSKLQQQMSRFTGRMRPDEDWNNYPSWLDTPNNINISFILWLLYLAKGWGLTTYARERYAKLGTGSRWVQGNIGLYSDEKQFMTICKHNRMSASQLKEQLIEAHTLLS